MTQTVSTGPCNLPRRLRAEHLSGSAVLEAQALRYRVFREAFEADLGDADRALDQDDYDPHCQHLGVRDLATGELVATTRLLDHQAARRLGGFYSEEAFSLHGLGTLQGPILEVGRTCVALGYRNGGTIAVLWAELAEVLNQGGYRYLMGCASVPMRDGGVQVEAVMRRVRESHLCLNDVRAEPRCPVPARGLQANISAQLPPLLKAYLRLGAKICGEPCWDPAFQCADLFILLKREHLCPRYARHFKAAV